MGGYALPFPLCWVVNLTSQYGQITVSGISVKHPLSSGVTPHSARSVLNSSVDIVGTRPRSNTSWPHSSQSHIKAVFRITLATAYLVCPATIPGVNTWAAVAPGKNVCPATIPGVNTWAAWIFQFGDIAGRTKGGQSHADASLESIASFMLPKSLTPQLQGFVCRWHRWQIAWWLHCRRLCVSSVGCWLM